METPLSCLALRYGDDAPDFVTSETFVPEDADRRAYGQLFLTLRLSRPGGFQATLAPAIMETLRDVYYADLNLDPVEAIERALTLINDKLASIAAERGPEFPTELHVAVAVFAGSTLHVTVAGEGTAYLKRGPVLVPVSEGLIPAARTPDNPKCFFQIASGDIRESDIVLLSTHDLLTATTEHHVRAALQPQNFRTPRLLKAKLGIREPDLVLVVAGASLRDAAPAGVPGAPSWSQKVKSMLNGMSGPGAAAGAEGVEGDGAAGESSKLDNTWALVRSNLQRSWEGFTRRFSRQPLSPTTSRNAAVAVLVLILVLVGALLWGIDYSRRSTARAEVTKELDQIVEDRQTAQTRSIYDRTTAKTVLVRALERATKLKQSNTLPDLAPEIDKEIATLQETLNRVDNIYVRPEPRVVADLGNERGGIAPLGLFLGGNTTWAYDYNALYKIDLDKVDRRKVEVPDLPDLKVRAATYLSGTKSVVLTTEAQQLIEYKDGAFSVVETDATAWKPAVALAEYSPNPYVYLLDPAANQVWRYKRGRSTYSTPTGKLPAGAQVDRGVALAIDGAIYVLTADGQVVKTYNDKPAPFAWENFTDASTLKSPTKIFVDSNANHLYFLEPSTKRVVVTTKSGRYLAQYLLPKAGTLVDIAARESESTLYVLEDSGKIFALPLEKVDL